MAGKIARDERGLVFTRAIEGGEAIGLSDQAATIGGVGRHDDPTGRTSWVVDGIGDAADPVGDPPQALIAPDTNGVNDAPTVTIAAPGTNYAKVGTEFLVNTQTTGDQGTPTITSLANGGFVVTWYSSDTSQDGSGSSIKAQIYTAAGAKVGGEFLVNTATTNNQTVPVVSGLTNGGFVVAWTTADTNQDGSGASVKAQVFTAAGAKVGSEFLVNTQTVAGQYDPTITGLANGGFVVTWTDGNGSGGDSSFTSVKGQVFTASGAKVGSEFLVNTQTALAQEFSAITSLANGGFVATWRDQSGTLGDASGYSIKAQVFTAAGVKTGSEFLVNTQTASSQFAPAITGLANGGFVVTWYDQSGTLGDASGYSIKAQIFTAAGVAVSSEFLVNTATAADQFDPTVTGLANGGFVVTWTTLDTTQDGSLRSIKAQVFTAAGAKVGSEFLVNTSTFSDQVLSSITALPNGGFVVTWQDASGTLGDASASIKAQLYGPSGGAFTATEQVAQDLKGAITVGDADAGTSAITVTIAVGYGALTLAAGTSGATIVSGNGTGSVVVSGTVEQLNALFITDTTSTISYLANTDAPPASANVTVTANDGGNSGTGGALTGTGTFDIAITAVNDAPTVAITPPPIATGTETRVNTFTSGDQANTEIAMLTGGGHVVVWFSSTQDSGTYGIYAQRYDAAGTAQGGEVRVNATVSGDQVNPSVAALAGGGYLIMWEGNGPGDAVGVFTQRYNASGVAQGGETRVNTTVLGNQFNPEAVGLANGDYVVTWFGAPNGDDDYGIFMQRYNSAGTALGGEVRVNTTTAENQIGNAIAALSGGGFVVVWEGFGPGDPSGIFMQRFDAAGAAQGVETLVNTTISPNQSSPSVAALTGGNYVVTWTTFSQDGSGNGVYMQRFTATGVALGVETRVNVTTSGNQDNSIVTALTDGSFVVSWQSDVQDGSGLGVYSRRYDASGIALTGETRVNTTTAGAQGYPGLAATSTGGYIVAWEGAGATDTYGVFLQRYAPAFAATEQVALSLKGGFAIADADAGSATLTATLAVGYGILNVAVGSSGATIVSGNGTGSVVVSGTIAQLSALLNTNATSTVTFTANTDTPPASTTLTFTVDDGGNSGGAAQTGSDTETITITAVNDAPVVTANTGTLAYTENDAAVVVSPTLSLADPDNATLASATVQITANYGGVQDILAFTNTDSAVFGNITATYSAGLLTLTSSGATATVAQFEAALRAVTYVNTSDAPSTATRTITFRASDGTAQSNTTTRQVSVTANNDAPVLGGGGNTIGFVENGAGVVVNAAITVSDVDSTTLTGATVTIGTGRTAGDTLGFTAQNGITGSYNASTGVLTLAGSATLANYQAALRSITFGSNSDDPTNAARTISFVVNDGAGADNLSAAATTTVIVTATNDRPTLTGFGPAVTFLESAVNGAPQLLDIDVTLTDGEENFAGQTLTLSGALAEDVIAIRDQGVAAGQIGVSGGNVTYGGVIIGAVSGGSGVTPLSVDLNANASTAAVAALIQNFTYANASDAPTASRTLTLNIDGGFAGFGTFTQRTGAANPFNGIDVGSLSAPAFIDFDGDGDLDLVVGEQTSLLVYRNNGVGQPFTQLTGSANPFNGIALGDDVSPAFVDLDGDGDLDGVFGNFGGQLVALRNNGAGTPFTLISGAANPYNGINFGTNAAAAFIDFDGDGDLDTVTSSTSSALRAFRNNGNGVAVTELTGAANPFSGLTVGSNGKIAALDFDFDGDLDLVLAAGNAGPLQAYRNNGAGQSFTALTGAANPFNGISGPGNGTIAFNDFDRDGDTDFVLGMTDGTLSAFRNDTSTGRSIIVNVTAQNDAPILGGAGNVVTYTENAAGVAVDAALTVADVDSTTLTGATVTIGAGRVSGDTLNFTSQNGITGVYDAATGVLTLTGTATLANYEAALRSVTFSSTSDDPTNAARTVSFVVNDGAGANNLSAAVTSTVNVTPVNDAPALTGLAASVTFLENTVNAAPQLIDSDVTFIDPEGNFAGGAVILSGVRAEDRVAVRDQGTGAGQIGVTGTTITFGGTAIGTFTGGVGANLVVTLNASAMAAAVDALIENLTYANVSNAPSASRTLSLNVLDAAGAGFIGAASFTEATGAANPFAGQAVGGYASARLLDLDGDGDLDAVVGNQNGQLLAFRNNGSGQTFTALTGAANPFNAFNIVNFSRPALFDIDGDGDLDVISSTNSTNSATGNNGIIRAFRNNGPGLAFTEILGATADNPFRLITDTRLSEAGFVDLDGDGDLDMVIGSADSGSAIRAFRNNGVGQYFTELTGAANPFNGVTSPGSTTSIDFVDLDNDGDLDALLGINGSSIRAFRNNGFGQAFTELTGAANPFNGVSFNVPALGVGDIDGDGDADIVVGSFNSGALRTFVNTPSSGTSQTIVVNVTPQNDAPAGADATITINEDAPRTLNAGAFGFSDVDGNTLAAVVITTLPTAGALRLNGVDVVAGQSITAAQLAASQLVFTPAANANGTDYASFTFQVQDNGGTANGGVDTDPSPNTITFNVTAVNDAPVLAGGGNSVAYTENGAGVAVNAALTVSDVDSTTLTGATVTISAGRVAGDMLNFANQNGITGGYVAATGVLTLTGAATLADYQAALRSVTFSSTSEDPTGAARTVSFVVNDGAGANNQSAAATSTVNVTAVNDAPTVTIAPPGGDYVAAGGEVRVNTTTSGFQYSSSVAALSGGGYVLAWWGNGQGDGVGILTQRYDASGAPQGSEVRVNTTIASDQYNASVAALSGGGYVVTWYGNGIGDSTGVFMQRYDASGVAQGGEVLVNTTTAGNQFVQTVAALSSGGYVVAWYGNGAGDDIGVFMQRYDGSGAALGGEVLVNTTTAGSQFTPSIAALSNGGYLVTWSGSGPGDADGIFLQRFDASGAAQGGEVRVNTTIANSQAASSVTALSGGGYVVTWHGAGPGDPYGIFMQRYDASGVAQGGEVRVNTSTVIEQYEPSVAALSGGGYVVTWYGYGSADDFGVFMQRFDASGAARGGEIRVNATTAGSQGQPALAVLDGDAVVVTWNGNGPGDDQGVFLQRLEPTPIAYAATEQTPLSLKGGITVGDVDAGSGILTVAITVGFGQLTASAGASGVTLGGDTAALTVTGTLAQINAFLNSDPTSTLVYTADSDTPPASAGLTVSVSDGGNSGSGGTQVASAGTTIAITAVDDAPTAVADTGGATETTTASGNLLTNDTDPDGGAKAVTAVNGVTASVGQQIMLASGALLTVNADGTYSYDPNGKFDYLVSPSTAAATGASNGQATDSFTYTVNGGSSATVTVTVTGVDGPGDQLRGDGGDNMITGTPQPDLFNLSQGGNDTVTGGDSNDGFYFGAAFTATDAVDGQGGDLDQIGLQGNYAALTLGATSLIGIENLVLLSGAYTGFGDTANNRYSYVITALDAALAGGQIVAISANTLLTGENVTFDARAETNGSYVYYGGAGEDHVTGSQTSDGFFFGVGLFGAGDTIDGQGGDLDQLAIQGDYVGTNRLVLADGQLVSVENLVLISAHDLRFAPAGGPDFTYDVTLSDGIVTGNHPFAITANMLQAGESLTLDASAEADSAITVYGGAGSDVLNLGQAGDLVYGGAGNDTINGNGGADRIYGGLGADQLSGGAGSDTFFYSGVGDSTAAAQDHIVDFTQGDRIDLSAIGSFSLVSGAFAGAGQVRVTDQGAGNYLVEAETSGDGQADLSILVTSDHALGSSDFVGVTGSASPAFVNHAAVEQFAGLFLVNEEAAAHGPWTAHEVLAALDFNV